MESKFENILDKDEKIVKVFKPNPTKFLVSKVFLTLFSTIWLIFAMIGMIFGETEEGTKIMDAWLAVAIFAGVIVLILLLVLLFSWLYYRNVYYAYSNKRIIIRKGIFGIDYKSLDFKMIGANNVNVTLLDKILCRKTGSIQFGSMASPMAYGQGNALGYGFYHIQAPYEVYREIKSVIDEAKETK